MQSLLEKEIEDKFAEIVAGFSETTYSKNEQNEVAEASRLRQKKMPSLEEYFVENA